MPKTKADIAFDRRLKLALAAKDWETVEKAFLQYGHYLELIGS